MSSIRKYTTRLIAAVLLISVAAATLITTSCGDTGISDEVIPAREIVEAAVAAYKQEDIPASLLYWKDAETEENILDMDMAGLYFYDEFAADMSALTALADWALYIPATTHVFEIDVLRAETKAGLESASELLAMRLESKTGSEVLGYHPEEAPLIAGAEIFTLGDYAVLLATHDNKLAKGAIVNLLNSSADAEDTEAETTSAGPAVGGNVAVPPNAAQGEAAASEIYDAKSIVMTAAPVEAPKISDAAKSTEKPLITVTSHVENNMVIFAGTCERDASVIMRCGDKEYVYKADGIDFRGTVEWSAAESAVEVIVTAKAEGKEESAAQSFTIRTRDDVNFAKSLGTYYYIAGDGGRCFIYGEIADYEGTNKFNDRQIESIKNRLKQKVDFCESIGAELIYLVIPVPMNVYTELVLDKYTKNTSGVSRTSQFEDAAIEAGATVIDLLELFTEHKNDEFRLYHNTDTHWTHYGAYLGYAELMNYINKSWPDAKPIEVGKDIEFYKERRMSGDMPIHMGIEKSLMLEDATFARYPGGLSDVSGMFYEGTTRLNHDKLQRAGTIRNSNASINLPSIYVFRDSFGSNTYTYMNASFSTVTWKAMWDYKFNENEIRNVNPDYVLYLVTERNIDAIIG